jgi:outer membrane protein assembly factor BamC
MLRRLFFCGLLWPAVLLGGCQWTGDFFKPGKGDYKSETTPAKSKSDVPTMEIPPDLTKQAAGDTDTPSGDGSRRAVSLLESSKSRPAPVQDATGVLPEFKNARIERAGSERWLVIAGKPEQYWDSIKEFWQEAGFVISEERPDAGMMETDWLEHKPKVSEGVVRKVVGSVLDMQSSTAERDKFRTRLETNAKGETEIYVSHRGLEEVFKTDSSTPTGWRPRTPDPDLEAEYLRRLMVRLGSEQQKAGPALAVAGNGIPKKSRIVREGGANALEMEESFDRAWRRVGVALDRVGFTVEDRDRAKGLYYVRYADPDATREKKKSSGMFSSISTWFDQDKSTVTAEQYQIQVSNGAAVTRVIVLSKAGVAENSQTTQRILSLLNEQLE